MNDLNTENHLKDKLRNAFRSGDDKLIPLPLKAFVLYYLDLVRTKGDEGYSSLGVAGRDIVDIFLTACKSGYSKNCRTILSKWEQEIIDYEA